MLSIWSGMSIVRILILASPSQYVVQTARRVLPTAKTLRADIRKLINYSIAEITCGIICGCLPALPAFIRQVSDIRIKVLKAAPNGNHSTFASWSISTRRPKPDVLISPGRPPVLPPLSTDIGKSPTFSSTRTTSTTWRDKSGTRHHGWKELDELKYVAGDNERYAREEGSTVEPQRPPPVLQ